MAEEERVEHKDGDVIKCSEVPVKLVMTDSNGKETTFESFIAYGITTHEGLRAIEVMSSLRNMKKAETLKLLNEIQEHIQRVGVSVMLSVLRGGR